EVSFEISSLPRDLAALDRTALGPPFLQAAIQYFHVAMAEREEHPPRPRRGDPGAGIIRHDGIARRDAEGRDVTRELFGIRKHMRPRIVWIGDGVNVEEH